MKLSDKLYDALCYVIEVVLCFGPVVLGGIIMLYGIATTTP